MKEDFLHYVWKHQKFSAPLYTQQNQALAVVSTGWHNHHAGPDFQQAQLVIGDLHWAGAVELHLKSSDWYRHRHEKDAAYDNVILHVVWEDDVEVCRSDVSILPTLVLQTIVPLELLERYNSIFFKKAQFIPYEDYLGELSSTNWIFWKERLFIERLDERSRRIQALLKKSKNDWEATLFALLARNFGLNVNGATFLSIAHSFPFSIVRKLQHNAHALEALFLGQANLLPENSPLVYPQTLKKEYLFLKKKFGLFPITVPLNFSRLRPHNFPTIRLVQLAQLYAATPSIFSRIFSRGELSTAWMEDIGVSSFWKTHYTFAKHSRSQPKRLSKSFIELVKINTLIPFYFAYQKANGNDVSEKIVEWIRTIKMERNGLIERYQKLGIKATNALDSQALIQLHKNYCMPKKCLLCTFGNQLMKER